jgi:hypothetical protein
VVVLNNVDPLRYLLEGTTEGRVDKATSDPIPSSIETWDLSYLHFHEITFVTAHNAHANTFAAGDNVVKQLATNQKYSIYQLLKHVGVRGLMLDIEFDAFDSTIRLVHGSVDFNSFEAVLAREVVPFLDEDPDAIITIDLETKGDRSKLRDELKSLFHNNPSFAERVFRINHPMWKGYKEWPTALEMRQANQRVIILVDSYVLESDDLGIIWRNDVVIVSCYESQLLGRIQT